MESMLDRGLVFISNAMSLDEREFRAYKDAISKYRSALSLKLYSGCSTIPQCAIKWNGGRESPVIHVLVLAY